MVDFNWDRLLPRKISDPFALEGQFSKEEIKISVFSLPGEKSPGTDGFLLCFFWNYWDDVKRDVFEMFVQFYNSDDIDTLRSINQTFNAFIPKKTNVEKIQDYLPISLLNSSYKIISKCLAAKFSLTLNSILDDSQCTFLLRRNISDCYLVAQETLHLMHTSKISDILLKLDFEKAFDNVNWDFIISTLRGLGCVEKWIQWIRMCISTTKFSILINGPL